MVFYLKYRPQKFADLDSENVRETLLAVLSSKKSSFHAFLFTGPKGLGKTSTARIVAKFLNCENRKAGDDEPCNRCYQCKSITSGSNLDVLEIDAASNRGIDEIRSLRDQVKLSTAGGKFRVYIIDEVHMLTNEAFNALLKTLEEPPSHAVFILCTTEPQKVPATIASRCLNVQFRKATKEELLRSFRRIISKEKINVDKEALELIADLSDESFRDGSKLLEEMALLARGRKITKNLVEENYKIVGFARSVTDMVECFFEKKPKEGLDLISKLEKQGIDFKYFTEQIIEMLHETLLGKFGVSATDYLEIANISSEDLKSLIELLMKSNQEIKYSILPQLPLELAIIEWSLGGSSTSQEDAQSAVSTPPIKQASSASAESSAPSVARQVGKSTPDFLNELIAKVNSQNHSVAGVLRGTTLGKMNGKKIILEAKYKFHKEKLEDKKTLEFLEKSASEILKKNVTIEVELGGVK